MASVPLFPTIELDASKCTTPFDCKKCLQICPEAVFSVHAIKVEKGKETNAKEPGTYMLLVRFRDKCTGCMDCVEICPVDALKITFPEA